MKKILLFFFFISHALASNYEVLKNALIKEYESHYAKILIKSVELDANGLPKDFESYQFLRIDNLRFDRANGYLRAVFKNEAGQRNFFFRYFIKADLQVLRANRDLKRGERLGALDYTPILMSFDKVPLKALSLGDDLNLIAKTNIAKNAILRQSMFKEAELIKKGALVRGILKEAGVQIFIELSALQGGNKGDLIKLKNKEGKLMQGVILDKNQVQIQ